LIHLFDFEIEGLEGGQSRDGLRGVGAQEDRFEEQGGGVGLRMHMDYDPFGRTGASNTSKDGDAAPRGNHRLSSDQVSVILWSRRLFLFAQEAYLRASFDKILLQELQVNKDARRGTREAASEFEKQNLNSILSNGGITNLNFLISILRQALLGPEWCQGDSNRSRQDTGFSADTTDGSAPGKGPSGEPYTPAAASRFQTSPKYHKVRQ